MDINILTFFEENMYLFLVFIPFIGQLGIPCGSIFFLLFAGSLSTDITSIATLFLIATISAILGDLTAYILGNRFFHLHWIERHMRKPTIKKIFEEVGEYFKKEGKMAIFITRFLVVTPAPYLNYILGTQDFDFRIFARLVVFGEILYVAELLALGYIFQDTFDYLTSIISYAGIILIIVYIIYLIAKAIFKNSEVVELNNI